MIDREELLCRLALVIIEEGCFFYSVRFDSKDKDLIRIDINKKIDNYDEIKKAVVNEVESNRRSYEGLKFHMRMNKEASKYAFISSN